MWGLPPKRTAPTEVRDSHQSVRLSPNAEVPPKHEVSFGPWPTSLFTSHRPNPYAIPMWYVEKIFTTEDLEKLPPAGFSVSNTRGVARIEKYGCGAELRRSGEGLYKMTELPTIMLNGQFTLLWDAGYQKFLITNDEHKFPAHKQQLVNLRKFNEELRTSLGVPTYYNEALGSTCHYSVYDRLKGLPGADPDVTLGIVETDED
jgi:hypothetical protein